MDKDIGSVKCKMCGKKIHTSNINRKYCYECRLKMLKVWDKRKNEKKHREGKN